MTASAGAMVQTLAREGGRSFDAYLVDPQTARGPAILVLHDMFGLNESIRAVADHYAGLGYAALVPNLFWRSKIPEPLSYDGDQHPIAWDRLKSIDLDVVSADMRLAVEWLRGPPLSVRKVAAIGFCGGGRFAFLAAVRCGVDAAVSLYGLGISEHVGEIGNASGPLQLHYGLQDQHIPRQEIDAVAEGVRGCPSAEVFLYPQAGHSFANPVRPTYDAAATQLAGSRIERMLEQLGA